jgi:hypothetical protein
VFESWSSGLLKVALDSMSTEVGYILDPEVRGAMSSKEVGSESTANTMTDLMCVCLLVVEL